MKITKKIREEIFNKYDGHCAYCGCQLQKSWHIDHLKPIKRNTAGCDYPENDNIDNLMPSCPQCNINKHQMTLEQFRDSIYKFVESLEKYSVQYQMAKKFSLIEDTYNVVDFYFETYSRRTKELENNKMNKILSESNEVLTEEGIVNYAKNHE